MSDHQVDWQRLAWLCEKEMPSSRFYRLWAATAIRLGLPFFRDGAVCDGDSKAAWQEWARAHGEIKPRATL